VRKVIEGTAQLAALPAPNGQSPEAALEHAPLPKSKHKPNRLTLEEVGPSERCRDVTSLCDGSVAP
jgi:hypothetical protein